MRARCSTASAFFGLGATRGHRDPEWTNRMDESSTSKAQQIAQAARTFEEQATGRPPSSVAVVLSEDTVVLTLRGTLSPAEAALAKSPEGAAQCGSFIDSSSPLLPGRYDRRSGKSPELRCGKRTPRSKRRPERWCKYFHSLTPCRRTRGVEVIQARPRRARSRPVERCRRSTAAGG